MYFNTLFVVGLFLFRVLGWFFKVALNGGAKTADAIDKATECWAKSSDKRLKTAIAEFEEFKSKSNKENTQSQNNQ